jgi:parvulin-like peptidyl-prolyl isomerase
MTICVNGQAVPDEAVEYELARLIRFYSEHMSQDQIRKQMDALRQKAREQAVGARLLMAEAARLDLPVTDAEVDDSLNEMVERAGGPEAFSALLTRQGLSRDGVRQSIRQGKRLDKLIARIAQGVADPTEAELKAHYDAHRDEYMRPERAQARHILIKPESDTAQDRSKALETIETIRKRVVAGSDFSEEAATHSSCPSGRRTGGSLGWFSRGMMVPEFDEAVFSMAVGDLSGIVETTFGYHLIDKTGQEDAAPADYEDIREKVREFLRHTARGEAIAAYVADLKGNAVIEED